VVALAGRRSARVDDDDRGGVRVVALEAAVPVSAETEHYVFHAAVGDAIDTAWQEAYHAWAIARLGVQPGRKIGYYKYTSRQDMGDHTGKYGTNGYADVTALEIHTLWSTDNHEVVHLFVSLVGRRGPGR
jgi:hypothetical protein